MRILVASVAPWCSSGYGIMCKKLARSLKDDGHDVAILATYGLKGGLIWWGDIPVYPGTDHTHASDVILAHVDEFKPDIVISILDVWPMENYGGRHFRWVPWVPIDHSPVPPAVLEKLNWAWKAVSMSLWGQAELEQAGIRSHYIPLGISPEMQEDPEAGKAWRIDQAIPEDAFVFGMVGLNVYWPPRKGYDRALEAFAEFHKSHPDSILYLHTTPNAKAVPDFDLWKVIDFFAIPHEAVRFSDTYPNWMGYSDTGMRAMYNSFDCLIQATQGEGFGLPVVEAQACGTPVIATDCTTMPELVMEEMGKLVPWSDRYLSLGYAWQYEISVPKLVEAMEEAYTNLRGTCDCGQCGGKPYRRIVAMHGKNYLWPSIYNEYWRPLLQEIQEEIGARPEDLLPGLTLIEELHGATTCKIYKCTLDGQEVVAKVDCGGYHGDLTAEAKLLMDLDHPSIPKVRGCGQNGFNRPYMLTEYRGEPLGKILDTLSIEERSAIYDQIVSGTEYLHEQGLVHRDIKLENVVYQNARATLVDFGWAQKHTHPDHCVDMLGYGAEATPGVQAGVVAAGLPALLYELLPEGIAKEVAGSLSTGSVLAYTNVPGLGMPFERDSEVRWRIMAPDVKGKRVLDVGCNAGWFVDRALQEGAGSALGIDADPTIIEAAGKLFPQGHFQVFNVDKDDLNTLPQATIVFALSVIMHLMAPGRLWKLFDVVGAEEVYLECPKVGEYKNSADMPQWKLLAQAYGWDAELLGETDRDRPLFRLTRAGVPTCLIPAGWRVSA